MVHGVVGSGCNLLAFNESDGGAESWANVTSWAGALLSARIYPGWGAGANVFGAMPSVATVDDRFIYFYANQSIGKVPFP